MKEFQRHLNAIVLHNSYTDLGSNSNSNSNSKRVLVLVHFSDFTLKSSIII